MKKNIILAGGLMAMLMVAGTAFADTDAGVRADLKLPGLRGMIKAEGRMENKMRPEVVGKVTAVSGTSLTVSGGNDNRVFTVNTSTSTVVVKGNATTTVSNIVVGDNVIVQGTVSGSVITATHIRDGAPRNEDEKDKDKDEGDRKMKQPPFQIQGNGQPVVGGKVTAVSGNSLTLSTKTNVSYTVDVSSAKFQTGNSTSSLSNISVGDNVIVQGAVNGTSVNASLVIEQGAKGTTTPKMGKPNGGMFKVIGNFFVHLFGF